MVNRCTCRLRFKTGHTVYCRSAAMGLQLLCVALLSCASPASANAQMNLHAPPPPAQPVAIPEPPPEQFLKQAQAELATLAEISDTNQRRSLQTKARLLIRYSRPRIAQQMVTQLAAWRQFPRFIEPSEAELRRRRAEAEGALISSQLLLAQCDFWEANTYDQPNSQHATLLVQAAAAFEEIHQARRSQVAGLYARLWQGKCFEERGDIRIALGIYEELLGHEGTAAALVELKDRALQYRLSCLNGAARRDFKLVQLEATQWLQLSADRRNGAAGKAIQWELCRALETLGHDRTLTAEEQQHYLHTALEHAEQLNHAGDEYKPNTARLIDRINQTLNGEPPEPEPAPTT